LVHVPTVPTPDTPAKDAPEREQFAGMVHYMDKQVGRIVSELERLGLRENTIVIFTTDNGTPKRLGGTMGGKTIPGGLGGLSEPGLDVPLVVNCPGRVAAGKVAGLADDTDFFPTIAELAGVPIPSHLVIDGHSFAAQLDHGGNSAPQREWIFTEYNKTRVIRDEQYKLYSTGEFFDVSKDLLEKNNLASSTDPTVVAARQKLQKVLDGLPPDIPPPFKPRSSSAFQIERKG
jgi:arylsulfatase A